MQIPLDIRFSAEKWAAIFTPSLWYVVYKIPETALASPLGCLAESCFLQPGPLPRLDSNRQFCMSVCLYVCLSPALETFTDKIEQKVYYTV